MPVLIPLEGTNLRFHPSLSRMTGIKLLVSAHLFIYTRQMYDNARYLINIHHRTLYIQRKRSIYVSSNHHPRKISAVPKDLRNQRYLQALPILFDYGCAPPSLRMAIMNSFSSAQTNNRNRRTACENKTLSLQNNSDQRSSIRIIIPVLEYEY